MIKMRSQAKILVVDDNPDVLNLLRQVITQAGHAVRVATDGDQALKLAAREDFDLLITDLIMPGKEGVETILAFRKKYPRTRIIAMSGGGNTASAQDLLGIVQCMGVASTLAKPFSRDELLTRINGELAMQA